MKPEQMFKNYFDILMDKNCGADWKTRAINTIVDYIEAKKQINKVLNQIRRIMEMKPVDKCENCGEDECQTSLKYKGKWYKLMACLPDTYEDLPKDLKEKLGIYEE